MAKTISKGFEGIRAVVKVLPSFTEEAQTNSCQFQHCDGLHGQHGPYRLEDAQENTLENQVLVCLIESGRLCQTLYD